MIADSPATDRPALVMGLGNLLREDEGAGLHVINHLHETLPADTAVDLLDGGTGGLHLMAELEDRPAVVVVDATRMGLAPGEIGCYVQTEMDRFVNRRSGWNVHDVGLPDLFGAAQLLPGGLPPRRALVGMEPASFDWRSRPSAPVAAAVPRAADAVMAQLRGWAANPDGVSA